MIAVVDVAPGPTEKVVPEIIAVFCPTSLTETPPAMPSCVPFKLPELPSTEEPKFTP